MSELRGVPDAYRGVAGPIDELGVFRLMAKARALEERLIKMSKSSDGYFWIGGPGEEAFNVPLGLLVRKGFGPDHDYLHLHYRSSAIVLAMGGSIIDFVRQMANRATDPFTGGRNFINHVCRYDWNIVPATSPIEVQYSIAPGTALVQRRHGGQGITIVNGGDAGSAEGDFATCLNWSSRPGRELPILILVTNNKWGISTPAEQVQGCRYIAQRGEPFGIRWDFINGNDPVSVWSSLSEVFAYVRKERKPFVLEATTSRLHGHSSSSGAARIESEPDCLLRFEAKLIEQGKLTADEAETIKAEYAQEALDARNQAVQEPEPSPDSIHDHTFA
ncbi:MAG: thiamine pyrophosphate-dependent dehydrogenase E1 component subunit alpha [Myxococcota bacterium]